MGRGIENLSWMYISYVHLMLKYDTKQRRLTKLLLILQIIPYFFAPSTTLLGLVFLVEKAMVTEVVATFLLAMHTQTLNRK